MKRTSMTDPFGWNDFGTTCVIDIETTIKNRGPLATGSSKASPHHPGNDVVAIGWLNTTMSDSPFTYHEEEELKYFLENAFKWHERSFQMTLVGHNIKFDLLYLLYKRKRAGGAVEAARLASTVKLWDTMVVEYLLTGQQMQVPSLDTLAAKYKLPLKDDKIKEYWNNDIDTEFIPKEELLPYLEQDVSNTYQIYKQQYLKAVEMDMLPLIDTQMELLLATTLMELNGMHVDIDVFAKDMRELLDNVNAVEEELYKLQPDLNPDSPTQIQAWLYGGELTKEVDEPVLDKDGNPCYFKSGIKKGLLKTKKNKVKEKITGVLDTNVTNNLREKNSSEDTLREILDNTSVYILPEVSSYLVLLLKYRELSKEYKTYYVGVGNLIWNHDDCIHGNLNMAVTATGRLASSSPNLQNMPGYSED